MKRKAVLVLLVVIMLFPGMLDTLAAKPAQLKNFTGILESFKWGSTVKVVIHYQQCKLISENEEQESVPDAVGGMTMDSFEYFAPGSIRNKNGYISASKTVLINHPRYGVVLNYAKIRINDNQQIQVVVQYLDPRTYEIKMDESFYTMINDGKNKGAAYFYSE